MASGGASLEEVPQKEGFEVVPCGTGGVRSRTSFAHKKESELLPSEKKDLEHAFVYAKGYENNMKESLNSVDNMGSLGLWWDSKHCESSWFFIRFKFSDKEEMKKEIKKYLAFYGELCSAIGKIDGKNKNSGGEGSDPYSMIFDLYNLLSKMQEESNKDMMITESSTIFKLHKNFISKHKELENLLKRVECVAARGRINEMSSLLGNCQDTIHKLETRANEFQKKEDHFNERIDFLVGEINRQNLLQNELLDANAELRQSNKVLLQLSKMMSNQMQDIQNSIEKLTLTE